MCIVTQHCLTVLLTLIDTTMAELIKQVTDKKQFLDVIYCEQGC